MARIVLISPYLKGGQNAAKLAQRTRYVATRPGVELLADERSTLPATKKQQEFIARLLKSFPSCWELIEYEEYLDHPTQGSASAFIQQVQEDYMEALEQKEILSTTSPIAPASRRTVSTGCGTLTVRYKISRRRYGRWRSTPEMYGHRWWRCAVRTQSGWAMTTRKTGRLW